MGHAVGGYLVHGCGCIPAVFQIYMIHIETKTDDDEMELVIQDEEDLVEELSGLLAVFKEHFPDVLAKALDQLDDYEAEIEEHPLDELFEECLRELDLMMKVRGGNNAKS